MPTLEQELQKIADLAYLELDEMSKHQLTQDVGAIMEFVEQLRQMDTVGVEPLFHPLDLQQRLRSDDVQENNCVDQLKKIAPLFIDDFYLVPKVIDSGK
jgi:aspartyl-tRNA(Asn)/glutamyl-tRNA(Gln) amidotransferase subunit C